MNIYGVDVLTPSKTYITASKIVMALLIVTILSFLALHITVAVVSVRETVAAFDIGILLVMYLAFVAVSNLAGLFTFLIPQFKFSFFESGGAP